jgi:Na+/H+ antiporter NhaD/arsenite permease-like protein
MFRNRIGQASTRSTDVDVLQAGALITDPRLLLKSLIVMAGVLLGFLIHGALHLEPATIAMAGATILLLWSRRDPQPILQDIEWTTLFFFLGLFITVEALVEVGIIEAVADAALRLTGGNLNVTATLLLWFSAIASGIVDNIPYTTTLIPIVESLGQTMPVEPLWWSLALGACLGGNTTLVGASANVVVADLADRSGHPIGFREFLSYGLVTALMSVLLSTVYVWLRYLLPLM